MTLQNANDTGPLRIGDTFLGRYQILGVMGRGGFGYVYRARSQFMGREVAIKIMARQNKLTDELRARGQREAIILGQLEHPNIVRVYEAEVSPTGHLYIVMELLEGVTLGERIHERGPFGVREGLVVLEKLCLALDSAHAIKAVHRDLKPANIFMCKDGSPRILDFGIAKLAGNAGWQTAPNMVIGTSLYVSPEQIRGQPASHLSDIYALGLVAFQMFHGTHPLILREPNANLRDPQAVWHLQIKTQAPMLDQVVDGFPSPAARLVNTALAKDPGQRFQSAREMAEKVRIALLKLDADDGRHAAAQFSFDDTVAVERNSPPSPASPPEDDREGSSAPAGTEHLNLRRTRKLFETFDSPPDPATSGPEKKAPRDARSTPPVDAALAERTSEAVQNVSRTLSLPHLKRPLGLSPLWIGGVAVVLGVLAGVGLIAVIQPFAPRGNAESESEIVIQSVSEPAPPAASPSTQKTKTPQPSPTLHPPAEKPAENQPRMPPTARPSVATSARPQVQPSAPSAPQPTATSPQAAKTSEKAPKPRSAPADKTNTPTDQGPTVPDSGLWQ